MSVLRNRDCVWSAERRGWQGQFLGQSFEGGRGMWGLESLAASGYGLNPLSPCDALIIKSRVYPVRGSYRLRTALRGRRPTTKSRLSNYLNRTIGLQLALTKHALCSGLYYKKSLCWLRRQTTQSGQSGLGKTDVQRRNTGRPVERKVRSSGPPNAKPSGNSARRYNATKNQKNGNANRVLASPLTVTPKHRFMPFIG